MIRTIIPPAQLASVVDNIGMPVSGYVKDWYDDIGAHVKKGQVLAVLDTPDLDQQLAQPRADLMRAQEDEQLAQITYDRWKALAKQNIVSQQAKYEKYGALGARTASVQAAQANVARLEALASCKNLTAGRVEQSSAWPQSRQLCRGRIRSVLFGPAYREP